MIHQLPVWASQMRDLFKSGSVSQFLIHGNIFDVVGIEDARGRRLLSLKAFLKDVMFESYDVVLEYDRGRGIRLTKGGEDWGEWLQQILGNENSAIQTREPGTALELIDRYLLRSLNLQALRGSNDAPKRIAVIIDFAEFVVPRGDPIQLSGPFSANVVKVLGWANDPAILQSNILTVLLTEGLHDLNALVVENPHIATLKIPLPSEAEMLDYLQTLIATQFPQLSAKCEVTIEVLARRLTGLSRVGARRILATALTNDRTITAEWLLRMKKDLIERECQDLMEFLESPFTLDQVAGHDAVKSWLREDTQLMRRGSLNALPMGYLITGRIGTGKTFLVQCWAGELGVPCVVFKNFRDRWVGATESNLEKIFSVLHALGQVVVFVDEADQAAGKRNEEGDSGLSGRVYSMLAKEMSDTRNRGRIVWVFATSRPDLLEVDLKRQGRLDVHMPLFPPQTTDEMRGLLLSIAKKLKLPLNDADIPPLPEGLVLGGNEVEGILVRALRLYELVAEPRPPLREIVGTVLKEVRPNAHTRKLEYMDLIAVKECTDSRFLPPAYRDLTPEELEGRIETARRFA
ncbi:MAG TPA: AAA family ATPase [Terriglobia bacterium]|nr:AAA family ATPase [Terriglobia bacterium]